MLNPVKRPSMRITQTKREYNALIAISNYGILRISPKNESIIRITYTRGNDVSGEIGIGIVYDQPFADWHHDETDKIICLKTALLTLTINKETASIRYADSKGNLLLAERDCNSRTLEEFDSFKMVIDENTQVERIETADGVKQIIRDANRIFDKKLFHTRLFLNWQEDEALFGLGQAEEGTLNLRGTTQYLHQANMKIAVPFLLSTKGYGLLLATGSPAIFNDTEYGSYIYTEADEQMDFYFIAGHNFDEIIKGYRLLSGKATMLPKWAFGYIQSQERYETADELIRTVKEYRNRQIGLDCIVLDWISWKDGMWGQKTFDERRFPDPARMMEQLHELNARLMISIWPSMNEACDNYREFFDKHLLLPASNIYNAFDEAARRLYWEQTNRGLFKNDIDAWWCDSSEPLTPEWARMEKPEPSNLYHEFIRDCGKIIPLEKCNAYGLVHAQGIYEGQRSVTEAKRVVNLTRSGYTGQQKYGTVLWSGDICASWDTFKKQIVAGLNFCASGLPYWTLDIGAFFVKQGTPWYWSGEYEGANEDNGYKELYVRWFQYGAFLPMFRAHGTDARREIWAFGEPGNIFYDALVDAVKLRYSLMPYIYSLAGSVWYNDNTILRMLAFDFPNDKIALTVKDQFMFGPSLMICPVTTPMYYSAGSKPVEGVEYTRKVYLPKGTRWYDFRTNLVYEGGSYIDAAAELSEIPIFVREGSILPMTKSSNYTDEYPDAPIELRIYPGQDGEFMLYTDSGDGYAYEKGEYRLTNIKWNDLEEKLTYETVHEHKSIKPSILLDTVIK